MHYARSDGAPLKIVAGRQTPPENVALRAAALTLLELAAVRLVRRGACQLRTAADESPVCTL